MRISLSSNDSSRERGKRVKWGREVESVEEEWRAWKGKEGRRVENGEKEEGGGKKGKVK